MELCFIFEIGDHFLKHYMLFNRVKLNSPLRLILRYLVEVSIIFLGITIYKKKLSNDLEGSTEWIRQLDSLRVQRTSNRISEPQLNWLHELVTGKEVVLFDSYSPTYSAAASSGLMNELPDTIRNQLYLLFQGQLPYFKLVYDQQQENITHFRNIIMIPANTYLYQKDTSHIRLDLQKFGQEIQRPVYGNFINQIIILEKTVYRINEEIFGSLTALEGNLRKYLKDMKE